MPDKITIVGGNGAMGQLFIKYFKTYNLSINTLDKNDWTNAELLLKNSNVVIICVPIKDTIDIISQISKLINSNTLLIDFTSTKTEVLKHMRKCHNGPILSLHPMFGPTIPSPVSQVIINCGGEQLAKSLWFINLLSELGFRLIDMDCDKHDEAMSFIQGIEHFSTFVLGSFLKHKNWHPDELFKIASPIYQTKLALLGRIFDQDAQLYADIIMSDTNRIELIEEYVKWLNTWLDKIKELKKADFVQEFNNTHNWMGEFTHQSQLASDQFLTHLPNISS